MQLLGQFSLGVIGSQIFQLVNGVPSVFVDGPGVSAEDCCAFVADYLRYKEGRHAGMGQPGRERRSKIVNPEIL
jgi:hypothetical protein